MYLALFLYFDCKFKISLVAAGTLSDKLLHCYIKTLPVRCKVYVTEKEYIRNLFLVPQFPNNNLRRFQLYNFGDWARQTLLFENKGTEKKKKK